MKVTIQNILWPKVGVCTESGLYYRSEDKDLYYDMDTGVLIFEEKKVQCDFSTYFNGVSLGKWKKYTNIGDVDLVLNFKGYFEIEMLWYVKRGGSLDITLLSRHRIQSDGTKPVILPYNILETNGMLAFTMTSLEPESEFYGGRYETDVDEELLNNVNIAINICTYKREQYILRNIKAIKEEVLENPENELSEHLQVFISDNGHTLPIDELVTDKLHIVQNKNVGGAGGFSRGLIEILNHKDTFAATHAIMMDDDVVIETEAFFRTYQMLRCRKAKYADMFIGGAMLRMDHKSIQTESGASWNAGSLVSNKSGLNLNDLESCLYNEVEEYTEFNAWWYCCTPMNVVKTDNLPLPIFIRGDDLEYGLRNMKTLVLMNGICVWHESFDYKYSSFLQYYILRNLLYDNALHFKKYSKKRCIVNAWRSALREIVYYRYKNVYLIIRGINDFLKGVDFLLETDGEKLHKEIMAAGYKSVPVADLDYMFNYPDYDKTLGQKENIRGKIKRYILFNGYLCKAKKHPNPKYAKCVPMVNCKPMHYYREKVILNYDAQTEKGFVVEKNNTAAIHCFNAMIGLTFTILKKFDKAFKSFGEDGAQVQSKTFWDKYLNEN